MRLAQSTSDGTWTCLICGLTGHPEPTQPNVDRSVFTHLRETHDRILITPIYPRNHDGITTCITAYHGRPLTEYEALQECNQKAPTPPRRTKSAWRR